MSFLINCKVNNRKRQFLFALCGIMMSCFLSCKSGTYSEIQSISDSGKLEDSGFSLDESGFKKVYPDKTLKFALRSKDRLGVQKAVTQIFMILKKIDRLGTFEAEDIDEGVKSSSSLLAVASSYPKLLSFLDSIENGFDRIQPGHPSSVFYTQSFLGGNTEVFVESPSAQFYSVGIKSRHSSPDALERLSNRYEGKFKHFRPVPPTYRLRFETTRDAMGTIMLLLRSLGSKEYALSSSLIYDRLIERIKFKSVRLKESFSENEGLAHRSVLNTLIQRRVGRTLSIGELEKKILGTFPTGVLSGLRTSSLQTLKGIKKKNLLSYFEKISSLNEEPDRFNIRYEIENSRPALQPFRIVLIGSVSNPPSELTSPNVDFGSNKFSLLLEPRLSITGGRKAQVPDALAEVKKLFILLNGASL